MDHTQVRNQRSIIGFQKPLRSKEVFKCQPLRAPLRYSMERYLAHVRYYNAFNLLLFYREIVIWVKLMS